jgi:hypothetical protein
MVFEKSMLLENMDIFEFITFINQKSIFGTFVNVQNALNRFISNNNEQTRNSRMEIESYADYNEEKSNVILNDKVGNPQNLNEEGSRSLFTNSNALEIEQEEVTRTTINSPSPIVSFIPPGNSKNHTLVLDLDETLVHFINENGKSKFLIRPYAYTFLKNMSAYFEIIIFTAAEKKYADWILNKIDTNNVISHRLYREHCQMNLASHLKVELSGFIKIEPRPIPHDYC